MKAEVGKGIFLTQHHAGNGRGLSTGKLLPPDWRLVKVTIKVLKSKRIVLEVIPVVKEA
jgi:hypothetical protein